MLFESTQSEDSGKTLESQEKSLHAELPESVEKVVNGKKILSWQKLLEQNGYDDLEVVKFMKEGVLLVGAHDHPACYALTLKLAKQMLLCSLNILKPFQLEDHETLCD